MHNSFEENGSNIAVVIVAQKEPHAGSLAFKDISQPETVAERTEPVSYTHLTLPTILLV